MSSCYSFCFSNPVDQSDSVDDSLTWRQPHHQDLSDFDITAKLRHVDILMRQPLVPKVLPIEEVATKLPHNLKFVCAPFHPFYLPQWEKLVNVCSVPITSPAELIELLNDLSHNVAPTRQRGSSHIKGIELFLQKLDNKTIIYNGLTEAQIFIKYTIPIMQRAVINLPYALFNDCNWFDHTVIPLLNEINLVPASSIQKDVNGPNPFNGNAFGFSIEQLLEEIQAVLKAPGENKEGNEKTGFVTQPEEDESDGVKTGATSETSTVEDVEEALKNIKISEDEAEILPITEIDENADKTTHPPTPQISPGFYFGPGLNKLVLSRQTTLGLLAVGFFGFQPVNPSPVKIDYSKIQPPYKSCPAPTQTRTEKLGSIEHGCLMNMTGGVHSPSVLGKMKAMMSYFAYFVPRAPSTKSKVDHAELALYAYAKNAVGFVEFIWKSQSIQVDYVIDTILNMMNIHKYAPFYSKYPENAPKEPVLPLDLMPIGARRNGAYITHPKLFTLEEFTQINKTTPSDISAAFYDNSRYSGNNHGDLFKRWLYCDNAQYALFLMLLFSHQPLHQQTFIGYSGDNNAAHDNGGPTITNGHILHYARLTKLQEILKNNASSKDFTVLLDTIMTKHFIEKQNVKSTVFLNADNYKYLSYDQTYPPVIDQNCVSDYIFDQIQSRAAPERYRIQSYPASQMNNVYLGDFANKFLGGGVLGGGAVQEELLFSEYAESLVGLMIAPTPMLDDTSINIQGCVMHAIMGGYASSAHVSRYMFCDDNMWEEQLTQKNQSLDCFKSVYNNYTTTFPTASILAYDSVPYSSDQQQFNPQMMHRQLTKLFSTLSPITDYAFYNNPKTAPQLSTFITGNWGCGVFGGNHGCIFLYQAMMCVLMDISLQYCSVGDPRISGIHMLIPLMFEDQGKFYNVSSIARTMFADIMTKLPTGPDLISYSPESMSFKPAAENSILESRYVIENLKKNGKINDKFIANYAAISQKNGEDDAYSQNIALFKQLKEFYNSKVQEAVNQDLEQIRDILSASNQSLHKGLASDNNFPAVIDRVIRNVLKTKSASSTRQ